MTRAAPEPGRTAYEARFKGLHDNPYSGTPPWADVNPDERAIWARVEEAVRTSETVDPTRAEGATMSKLTIPCPHCTDGFVTAGDRHARTRQDVCQHCAGTGYAPAETGLRAGTSAPAAPAEDVALSYSGNPMPPEGVEGCVYCGEPFKEGDMVLPEEDGGMGHVACAGPEPEGFVGADGEPLKDGDPIPTGYPWAPPAALARPVSEEAGAPVEGERSYELWRGMMQWCEKHHIAPAHYDALFTIVRKFKDLPSVLKPEGEKASAGIKATEITLGEGLVDITRITHEGRSGVLFRPRTQAIPFGEPGELQPGEYWPVAGDVVLWVSGNGPGVAIDALAALTTTTGSGGRAEGVVAEIAAERRRQVEAEGWTLAHDDDHRSGEMAAAASCYALATVDGRKSKMLWLMRAQIPLSWPWDAKWWKRGEPRRMLIKAAALLVAEIERRDRAAPAALVDEEAGRG